MEIELDDSSSIWVSIDSAWQAEQVISLQQSFTFNHMDARGHRIYVNLLIWKIQKKIQILCPLTSIWLKIELCCNDIIYSACQAESIETHIDDESSSSILCLWQLWRPLALNCSILEKKNHLNLVKNDLLCRFIWVSRVAYPVESAIIWG